MGNDLQLITTIYSYALLFSTISLISMWRIYKKAGQPGWAAIIPFYNIIVWLKIISKPAWWLILLFIPFVNIVILIWMINLLAKRFERKIGFTFGLLFLGVFFYPLLAFKDYKYIGNIEPQSNFVNNFEAKRDKLLVWSLGVFCFDALFWFILSNFIQEWWRYYYIHIPVGILLLFPFFLIGISVNNKYRTISIILSISILIIYSIKSFMPLFRDLM